MGKQRFQQKASKALKSIPSPSKPSSGISKSNGLAGLHRGRKKRLETRQRLEKKQSFIQSELAKLEVLQKEKRKALQQKQLKKSVGQALSILPNLKDSLPSIEHEADDAQQKGGDLKKNSNKSWSKLIQEEKFQMEKVQNHEAFINMGIDALKTHLSHTVLAANSSTSNNPSNKHDKRVQKPKNNQKHKQASDLYKQPNNSIESKAAERREYKKMMAEKAVKISSKKRNDVKLQSLTSLLGGKHVKTRGRIGEKRPKQL